MTVFETARQADCIQAAEKLGIRTRRSGGKAYACCLFHAEKTPSLCLYPDSGGFYCFGCHAHGDAVALYAQALSLSPLEAAKRVCADFGYDYDRRRKRGSYLPGKAPALNVRTLAKRLDDWREEKVRALLEIQRAAEARMEQIEESKDYIAAAEDETWREALVEKCAAQERIALLDSLSLSELLQEMKEETYGAQRTERAARWHNRSVRETILKDASGVYSLRTADFDRDPYLLNCQNGTLNLRTGEFREHRAEDFLSLISGVSYDADARCPRWERFMEEIMRSADAASTVEKTKYLQKAFGYALTGNTRYECLFILYGATTRNGKGTAMETFLRLMGDYGKTARPETIGARFQPNGSAPSEDVARFNGARFVNISEPDKKLTLSAALVKSLTGNDTITARYLHENSFEYRPQFKMFINTNYLPQITDLTLFSSGRIKTIPFERHFEEWEQDKKLKELFAEPENLSGILNWCIEGLRLLEAEGFAEPQAVRAATAEYEHESDKIALFMEECLQEEKGALCRTSAVYEAYTRWCEGNGFYAENTRNFRSMLAGYGRVERRRPSAHEEKTTVLVGYRIRVQVVPLGSAC